MNWDEMTKKQEAALMSAYQDMFGPPKPDPGLMNQIAAAQGTTQGGAGAAQITTTSGGALVHGHANGTDTLNAGGGIGGMTASQLHGMIRNFLTPLSKEQQDELTELRRQHGINLKQAKLNVFKALHSSLRQQVINAHEWKHCQNQMNNLVIEKDPRLLELEGQDHNVNAGQYMGVSTSNTATWYDNGTGFAVEPLPTGISLEDLKQAHMEASLEEEMLDNEPVD